MSSRTRSDNESDCEMMEQIDTYTHEAIIEIEEPKLDSQVFTQHLPVIGKVPMMFYIPPGPQFEELENKIKRNGGKVIDQHECATYQIKPDQGKTSFQEYYKGPIYSSKWINDSLAAGKVQNKDDYFICINIDEKAKMLNMGKKKKYTIIEGVKLYETLTNQKNLQINSSQFWQKVQKSGILPERTADSMRNFWKKNEFRTLEEFLIESIHEETDFCLSFKAIPNQEFVSRFKKQYANEFLKLQTLRDLDKSDSDDIVANKGGAISKSGYQTPKSSKGNSQSTGQSLSYLLTSALKEEKKSRDTDITMKDPNTPIAKKHPEEELKYQFKKIQKLIPSTLTYSPFEYSMNEPQIYLSIDKRPLNASTLEQELENHLSLRMKTFVPTDFDLVDYDKEIFKKNLDLETVQITLNRDEEKELDYEIKPYYVRSVVRFPNEEGMFRRLQQDLLQIGQEYGVSEEEINSLYFGVSCSKAKLVEALKGQSFTKWNELEDMALRRGTESLEFSYLLKTKGPDEILRRKKFLGI